MDYAKGGTCAADGLFNRAKTTAFGIRYECGEDKVVWK
jgi:hypothetical protein